MDDQKKVSYEKGKIDPVIELIMNEQKQQKAKKSKNKPKNPKSIQEERTDEPSYFLKHEDWFLSTKIENL